MYLFPAAICTSVYYKYQIIVPSILEKGNNHCARSSFWIISWTRVGICCSKRKRHLLSYCGFPYPFRPDWHRFAFNLIYSLLFTIHFHDLTANFRCGQVLLPKERNYSSLLQAYLCSKFLAISVVADLSYKFPYIPVQPLLDNYCQLPSIWK